MTKIDEILERVINEIGDELAIQMSVEEIASIHEILVRAIEDVATVTSDRFVASSGTMLYNQQW